MDTRTVINHAIGRPVVGYMLNTVLNEENSKIIAELQAKLTAMFGETVWNTPPETLHITLMDWLAPLTDYPEDKDQLFGQQFASYDAAFTEVLRDRKPVDVHFDTLKVTTHAIILIGHDNGDFQDVREGFLERVELLPNTKQPPTIIHITLARFRKEQDLQPITDYVSQQNISFKHTVTQFRLVRETIAPMLGYELVKEYPLA